MSRGGRVQRGDGCAVVAAHVRAKGGDRQPSMRGAPVHGLGRAPRRDAPAPLRSNLRRMVALSGFVLVAVPANGAFAQSFSPGADDLDAEYRDHFGDDGSSRESGPRSLEEARSTGRGYRIGQGAGSLRAGASPVDDVHVVQEGETLWSISGQALGDHFQWPRLWSYNPEISDPHWIYPKHPLRLTPPTATAANQVQEVSAAPQDGGKKTIDRVVVVPDQVLRPGMVLLRDQGYLDSEALSSLGEIVGAPEEHMVLSVSDNAYVRFSGDSQPTVGEELSVFRALPPWERYPTEQGTLVRIMGAVQVQSYEPSTRVARVAIVEAVDVIERGFAVARVARRFDLVEPKANEKDLTAHIIASTKPRGLIGFGDVVFLDVGQATGVVAGNRFFVVRRGDEFLHGIRGRESEIGALGPLPQYQPELMPQEVVAELRVVKVRKDTSIALVTRSDTDLSYGDTAEMRIGY